MQETNPTQKYPRNHEVSKLFRAQSPKRRNIGRPPKDKVLTNFNNDFEYEKNTPIKQLYIIKISPLSERNKSKSYENLSKEVNFRSQNKNNVQYNKTTAAHRSTTPRNKITTTNLQIEQNARKSTSNVHKKLKHKSHFENIRKEENKMKHLTAGHLHVDNRRTHIDTLVMNEKAGTTEILQQNVPSSSRYQSGKLYQNKDAIDKTLTGRYTDGAQNSSDLQEKACKDTFTLYKQIFKEARELYRQKMINNILWPHRKGCNNSVSHNSKEDMFVSSHNIYSTESKGMINQQKPSKKSAEQYKKTMSKNDVLESTFDGCKGGVTTIHSKSSNPKEGLFSNNDFVLDTLRHKLISKMDGIKIRKSQASLDRNRTVDRPQHINTTNGRHILRKCKNLTNFIDWNVDLDNQKNLKKNTVGHVQQFSDSVVTRKPDVIAMFEKKLDLSQDICVCTVADITNNFKTKFRNVDSCTMCNIADNCIEPTFCNGIAEVGETFNFDPCTCTDRKNHITLKHCDDLIESERKFKNNDNTTKNPQCFRFLPKKIRKKEDTVKQTEDVQTLVKFPTSGITIRSRCTNMEDLVKLEKCVRNNKGSTTSFNMQNNEKCQYVKPYAKYSYKHKKAKDKKKKAKDQYCKAVVTRDTEKKDTSTDHICGCIEKDQYTKTVVKGNRGNKDTKRNVKNHHCKPVVTLDIGENGTTTDTDHCCCCCCCIGNGQNAKTNAKCSRGNKNKRKKKKDQRGKSVVTLDTREKDTTPDMENFKKCQYVKRVVKNCCCNKDKKNNAKDQHNKLGILDTGENDKSTDMEDFSKSQCMLLKNVKDSDGNNKKKTKGQHGMSVTFDTEKRYSATGMEHLEKEQFVKQKCSCCNKNQRNNLKDQQSKSVTLDTGEKDTTTDMEHLARGIYIKSYIKNLHNKNEERNGKDQHSKSITLDTGEKDTHTDTENLENCQYLKSGINDSNGNKGKKKYTEHQHGKLDVKLRIKDTRNSSREKNSSKMDVKDDTGDKCNENNVESQHNFFAEDIIRDSELLETVIKKINYEYIKSSACLCKDSLEHIKKLLSEYCANRNKNNKKCITFIKKETQTHNGELGKPKDSFVLLQDNVPDSENFVKSEHIHKSEVQKGDNAYGHTQLKSLRINERSGHLTTSFSNKCIKCLPSKILKFPFDKENVNVEDEYLDKLKKRKRKKSKIKKTKSEETVMSHNKIDCSLIQNDRDAVVKDFRDLIEGYYNQGERSTSTCSPGVEKSAQNQIHKCYKLSAPGCCSMKTAKDRQTPAQNVKKVRNTKCLHRIPVIIKRVLFCVAVVLSSPCIIVVLSLYFCLGRKQTRPKIFKRQYSFTISCEKESFFHYYTQIFKRLTISLIGGTYDCGTPTQLESRYKHRQKIGRKVGRDLNKCKGLINSYVSVTYPSIPRRINLGSKSFKRADFVKHKRYRNRKLNFFKEYSQRNKNPRHYLAGGDATTMYRKKPTLHIHDDPKIKTYKINKLSSKKKCKNDCGDTETQRINPIQLYLCDKCDVQKTITFDEKERWTVVPEECRSSNRLNTVKAFADRHNDRQTSITSFINNSSLKNDKSDNVSCTFMGRCLKIPSLCCTNSSWCQRRFCPVNKKNGNMQAPISSYTNKYSLENDSSNSQNQCCICEKNKQDDNLQVSSQSCTHNSFCQRRFNPVNKKDGDMQTPIAFYTNKHLLENDNSNSQNQCCICEKNKKDDKLQMPSQSCTPNSFCQRRFCPLNKKDGSMHTPIALYTNKHLLENDNSNSQNQYCIREKNKKDDNLQVSSQPCTHNSLFQGRFSPSNKKDSDMQTLITSYKNKQNLENGNSNSQKQGCSCAKNKNNDNLQVSSPSCTHNSLFQRRFSPSNKKDSDMQTPIASYINKHGLENGSSNSQNQCCSSAKNQNDDNVQVPSLSCIHKSFCQCHFSPSNKKDGDMQTPITSYKNKQDLENGNSKRQNQGCSCAKNKNDDNLQVSSQSYTHNSLFQRRFSPSNKKDSDMQTPIASYTNKHGLENGNSNSQSPCCIGEKKNKDEFLQVPSQSCTHNSFFQRCFSPLNTKDGYMQTLIASLPNKHSLENNQSCIYDKNNKDENLQIQSESHFHKTKTYSNIHTQVAPNSNQNINPKNKNCDKLQTPSPSCKHNSLDLCLVNKKDESMQTQVASYSKKANLKKDKTANVSCKKIQHDNYPKKEKDRQLQTVSQSHTHNSSCQCYLCSINKKDRNMQTPCPTHANKYRLKKGLLFKYNRRLLPNSKNKCNQTVSKGSYQCRLDKSICNNQGISISIFSETNESRTRNYIKKDQGKRYPKKRRFRWRRNKLRGYTHGTQTRAIQPPLPPRTPSLWERCKYAFYTYKAIENSCNNYPPMRCYNVKSKEKPSVMRTFLTFWASICCLPCILYFCFFFNSRL